MRSLLWACLVVLPMVSGCAYRPDPITWVDPVRYAHGDSAQWSRADHDDARWAEARFWELPHPTGVLWIRTPVRLEGAGPFAVSIKALASHELWWDGVLVGRSGTVGRSAAEEVPGSIETQHRIPDSLAAAGPHVMAIRTSAFHQNFTPSGSFMRLAVGSLEAVAIARREGAWIALISLSGILLGALLASGLAVLATLLLLLSALLVALLLLLLFVGIVRHFPSPLVAPRHSCATWEQPPPRRYVARGPPDRARSGTSVTWPWQPGRP